MKSPLAHAALSLFMSAAILAGYAAWYGAVSNKSLEVANLQSQITAASETMSRIASARAALAEIADDEMRVRSYFVPEAGVVAFINDLEARSLAQGSAIDVASVSTGGSTARFTTGIGV